MALPITLFSDEHDVLVKLILSEFAEKFVPNGKLLYLGATNGKSTYINDMDLQELDIIIEQHKNPPNIILYDKARNWLVLIDAATYHGPITSIRLAELKQLFAQTYIGLVFVTAFLDYKSFREDIDNISWETEVWVAEAPSHMIHFDGERFLGPY